MWIVCEKLPIENICHGSLTVEYQEKYLQVL